MFDQKLSVIGEDIEIRLQHEKVIFVIEDIDAATSIVHRKKKKNRSKKKGASKPRVNGINGGMSDEQPESVQCTSAVEEDIMESPGVCVRESPTLFFRKTKISSHQYFKDLNPGLVRLPSRSLWRRGARG